ncbi:MAG: glucose-1-phosphate adenylyltransferase [candidate division Zixibacteria bacterium]|nr:glucose-1-phosphate adenylyltransferase [candidate division Zixibacteria bacterium]
MNRGPMASILRSTLTMVLAGGQGERLHPLTRDRAKPAVPFGGIYRIIDFTLSNCLNSNLHRIYVLTQYKSDSLNKHLRLGWNIFHEELDEFIVSVPPQFRGSADWYKGTADAIFQNVYTLQEERPERVLILAGDHIYRMDYGEMLQFHEDNRADLTVAAVEVDRVSAQGFGVMSVDRKYRITDFAEKPADPFPHPERPHRVLVSMGIYVFDTATLVRAISADARKESHHDFGKNIVPELVQSHRVFAYPFEDEEGKPRYWRDVGTLDSLWESNMDLVSSHPIFELDRADWPMRTYLEALPPARTVSGGGGDAGAVLDSMISNGCVINGSRVERSILSPNVRVEAGATVSESVVMDRVTIGRNARVRRAIIDKGVHIPDGYEIGYDAAKDGKKFAVTSKGVVVVPKGMILDHGV